MMDLLSELERLTAKLDEEGIDYALCGGLAMAVYALPRATLDVDMMIEFNSLTPARRATEALGFTLGGAPMEFQGGKVQIYRLVKIEPETGDELILDLLVVTPATTPAWESRQKVTWRRGTLSVVSPDGLIALKSLRNSGQDQEDIARLRSILDED